MPCLFKTHAVIIPSREDLGALVSETVKHQSIVNPHMKRWQCFKNALRRTLKFTSVIHISASKLDIYNVTYKKSI